MFVSIFLNNFKKKKLQNYLIKEIIIETIHM